MNRFQTKGFSLTLALVFGVGLIVSWSQTWFIVTGEISGSQTELSIPGQTVASMLSALGILNIAVVAALSLASTVITRILSVVMLVIGLGAVVTSFIALSSPISSALPMLSELSGLANIVAVTELINTISPTVWPVIAAICGLFLTLVSLYIFVLCPRWRRVSQKYDSNISSGNSTARKSDKKIEQWDAMSSGQDPTTD